MYLKKILILFLLTLFSMASLAQSVSHSAVEETQQNIQNSIRGTLDGTVNIPRRMVNTANQLVFPRSFNQNYSMNPWSRNKQQPRSRQQGSYGLLPKGNPWAPINDTQNIPFDNSATFEKNPYTDAPVPSRNNFGASAFSNNQNYNNAYGESNNTFASPFGNQFWPSSNNMGSSMPFMASGNNMGSSMPFIPW